jgi:uncharacterized protein (TIGR02996 family)
VTTEDDFQKALDADPEDWQTRLVFADWLEEQGDPRADGYRALGVRRFVPLFPSSPDQGTRPWFCRARSETADWLLEDDGQAAKHYYPTRDRQAAILPTDWFDAVELRGKDADAGLAPKFQNRNDCDRRELEDAVALGFAKLPAARRAELLSPNAEDAPPKKPAAPRAKGKKKGK